VHEPLRPALDLPLGAGPQRHPIELDEVLPIGATMSGLAVGYHERFAEEYRRFNPSFVVQEPGPFFGKIATLYCDAVFPGFDVSAVKRGRRIS
jgi:hypothetical protein